MSGHSVRVLPEGPKEPCSYDEPKYHLAKKRRLEGLVDVSTPLASVGTDIVCLSRCLCSV